MSELILQQAEQIVNAARAIAIDRKVNVMVRNVRCSVPRSELHLELLEEIEQSRDILFATYDQHIAGEIGYDQVEDAFDALRSTIERCYRHDAYIIRNFQTCIKPVGNREVMK
jgi:hypothetical protein